MACNMHHVICILLNHISLNLPSAWDTGKVLCFRADEEGRVWA